MARPASRFRRGGGFTLLETLVALAVLAIALAAAFRAVGAATAAVDEVQARLLAEWLAQNRLAEHRARRDWPPPGIAEGAAVQGGLRFRWREEVSATPNSLFRRIDLRVYRGGEDHALVRLTGFLTASGSAP